MSPEFRQSVVADPTAALAGYDLSAEERQSILNADLTSIGDAAALLDERVSKLTTCRMGTLT